MSKNPAGPVWLWALLPLLLAATFASIQLDDNAFNGDEPDSLHAAGFFDSGSLSLGVTWSFITNSDPDQAYGWPLLLAIWGRIVGWSEPAIRSLPFFAGMLALALVYRSGHDLLSPGAGLIATLLLGCSVFFLAYMAQARAFTLVTLCTTLILWSYWRIALHPLLAGRGARMGLLLGSIGLLYSHYFGSLFLPALGLFHLLFVTKNRRWLQPVLLVGLAILIAALQLPGFLNGMEKIVGDEKRQSAAMMAAEIPGRLLYFLTNYLFSLPPPAGAALLVLLPLALLVVTAQRLRFRRDGDALWLLVFVAGTTLLLMTAANEVVKAVLDDRIRYLMPLWPLAALLAGASLWHLASEHRRALAAILAFWLFLGPSLVLTATGFRSYRVPSDFHHIQRMLFEYASAGDLVVMDQSLHNYDVLYLNRKYVGLINVPWDAVLWHSGKPLASVVPVHTPYLNIWLINRSRDNTAAAERAEALGRVLCEQLPDRWGYTLERYARSAARCAAGPDLLEFERDIRLTGSEVSLSDGLLRFEAGLRSADDYLLAHYSLAVHIIDPLSGERVAQGDVGVGPGAFVPVGSEVDVSALPPGEYEVHVALYDWQSGERLTARDIETGVVSDMHTLHHFRSD